MQEEMMSHSTPGTIGGEFTKWLRAWMLRSEKSRASQSWTSKTSSKNNVRMIREKADHIESGIVKRAKNALMDKSRDQDQGKGAVEPDQENQGGNTRMKGQLGHRDEERELKNADSDLSG
jgi:hypothetical protein